jgi:hypothetical protein
VGGRSGGGPEGWIDRFDLDLFWRIVLPLEAAGAVASVTVVVATFLPGDSRVPADVGFLLFPFAFVGGFGMAVSERQVRRSGRRVDGWPRALVGALPRWQSLALWAVTAAGLVIVALSFVHLRGDPVQRGERYFLDYQGELTEVSHDDYVQHRKYHLRVFVGGQGLFVLAAVGTGLGHRRRRALDPPPDPWPGPQYRPGPGAWPTGSWPPARWSPLPPRRAERPGSPWGPPG